MVHGSTLFVALTHPASQGRSQIVGNDREQRQQPEKNETVVRVCHGFTWFIRKCSTIGPSASAGKKLRATKMIAVPTITVANSSVSVWSVPMVTGRRTC